MLQFAQVSKDRLEARFPVDWVLGMSRRPPETRVFAVVRRAAAGWLLYIHDMGRQRRPVEFDDLETAKRAASLVADMSTREFARLRTISGGHMAVHYGLDAPRAQQLAQTMRSAMVAKYALGNGLARTAIDRPTLRVTPRRTRQLALCR